MNIEDWRIGHESHAWLHRCFPPQPSTCLGCGAVKGTAEGEEPCRIFAMEGVKLNHEPKELPWPHRSTSSLNDTTDQSPE